MALTKVSKGLISTSIVDNGNATAITIDSAGAATFSGNVGIGISSPAASLDIRSPNTAVQSRGNLYVTTTSTAAVNEGAQISLGGTYTGTSETFFGAIAARKENATVGDFNAYLQFSVRNTGNLSEKARLTSDGNLLVGKTASDLGVTAGIELNGQYDVGYFTRSAEKALVVNRLASDGTIAEFRKDGTAVGSIGYNIGALTVDGGALRSGLYFGAGAILPRYNGALVNGGAADLGSPTQRFQGLYLSSGVYLGGTGAANHLDDYEEGTWTPSFSAAGSPSYTVQYGRYTKVGRIVYISVSIIATSVSGSATIQLSGLPFTPSQTSDAGQRSTYSPSLGGHCSGLSEATGRFRVSSGTDMFGVKGATTTTYMTAAEFSSGGSPQITGDFWYYTS